MGELWIFENIAQNVITNQCLEKSCEKDSKENETCWQLYLFAYFFVSLQHIPY